MNKRILFYCILSLLFVFFLSCSEKGEEISIEGAVRESGYQFPLSLKNEMKHSLEVAYNWLAGSRLQDGSWKTNPAITALVLYALVETPGYIDSEKIRSSIDRGYAYLEGFVRDDGGIYLNEYRNYTTAVALLAFTAAGKKEYKDIIKGAKNFLIKFQCDEGEGIESDDVYYGGIGYGGDTRPDLSNTHLALEAIKAAEVYEEALLSVLPESAEKAETENKQRGLHWEKALVFLARCQNLSAINPMPYRTIDDGGFMYETGAYKEDRSHSYGSMTYAGVKSLLYADVKESDIRIAKAFDWIRKHYTLEENPEFGTVSLYYYYMTFSKCLYSLGITALIDVNNQRHVWREDIIKKMISLQKPEGYWVNDNGRYWENIMELATAYSVLAMKFALKGLSEKDIG
ncbi:MAG: terpene cyclase/mutase family protein [Spirochaetales bacterium]|nr:terpene cyclase/mutase family protein [Spirochaetales bacterium]